MACGVAGFARRRAAVRLLDSYSSRGQATMTVVGCLDDAASGRADAFPTNAFAELTSDPNTELEDRHHYTDEHLHSDRQLAFRACGSSISRSGRRHGVCLAGRTRRAQPASR